MYNSEEHCAGDSMHNSEEPPEAQRPGSLAPGCATVATRPDRAVAHVGQGFCMSHCRRAGSTTRPLERRGAHR